MVYTQLNFHCLFSSAQSRLAKSFSSKSINCVRRGKNILSIMFYAKKIYFYHCLCSKVFNTIEKHATFFQGQFQMIYQAEIKFWRKKSFSTFQPFTYVSNERYLINEMCIEGFSQRLELRIDQHWNGWMPKILPKKLWYSKDILIDQWLYECFSVISSLPDNGGPHLHFTQLLYILVHFYALASHCTYILSCWKIEAYTVLVKFTFALAGMEVL